MERCNNKTKALILSAPFSSISVPSIQLPILEGYLKEKNQIIDTKHIYLKAADYYGIKNYNNLSNVSGISYAAQMVFTKYVFPEYWKKYKYNFREYFNKIFLDSAIFQDNFTFDFFIEKTDLFYNWVVENVNWRNFDIIGFSLNYGQFLPSLAIAKKIKEISPDKKIIFGGSRTVGELGKRVLSNFNYVDFIASGEGEETLYLLTSNSTDLQKIPNLIYRNNEGIIWNKFDLTIDLNSLPFLDFDTFYNDLKMSNIEVQRYFSLDGRLPIEVSRGCWWNNCTFCNLNIQFPNYKEKKINRIVEEIDFLSDKYRILNFHIIGNTLPKKDYRYLFEELKKLGKDFDFIVEARAGQLKGVDYKLMKESGFRNIQVGIESFSENYLKKINKGVRVIDNIATLKFCKEFGIKNDYNLIIKYPNEDRNDFEESIKNISLIKDYLDPPQLNNLLIGYGSYIYNNPDEFNIEKIDYTNIDKLMYPEEYLHKNISFYFNFKRKEDIRENNWKELVDSWKSENEKRKIEGIKRKTKFAELIFFYIDGITFLKIIDARNPKNVMIYILNKQERDIFLSCIDVISLIELKDMFSNLSEDELKDILYSFEEIGIIFKEDNHFLSLPLSYNIINKNYSKNKTEQDNLITQIS